MVATTIDATDLSPERQVRLQIDIARAHADLLDLARRSGVAP